MWNFFKQLKSARRVSVSLDSLSKTETQTRRVELNGIGSIDLIFDGDVGNRGNGLLFWIPGGGSEGGDWIEVDDSSCPMKWCTALGLVVVQLNLSYRSSWGFIDIVNRYRNLERLAFKEVQCSSSSFSLVVYSGFSGGATVALRLAKFSEAANKVVVSYAGYTAFPKSSVQPSIVDRYFVDREYFYLQHRRAFREIFGATEKERLLNIASASPEVYIGADYPPILLIHGSNDSVVSFNQSVRLHREVRRIGGSSTLVILDGAEHLPVDLVSGSRAVLRSFIDRDRSSLKLNRRIRNRVSVSVPDESVLNVYESFLHGSDPSRVWFSSFPGIADPLEYGFSDLVKKYSFRSEALNSDVTYYIHCPDGEVKALPILIHCPPHVISARQQSWSFTTPRYQAMRAGAIPKFAIVMVDHKFYGSSREREASESMLVYELLPMLRSRHQLATQNAEVVIEGDCESGAVALKVGLRNSEFFQSVIATNPIVDNQLVEILHGMGSVKKRLPSIRLEVGEQDPRGASGVQVAELARVLREKGAVVECVMFEKGRHDSLEVLLFDHGIALKHYCQVFQSQSYSELLPSRSFPFESSSPSLKVDYYEPASASNRVVIWIPGSDWRGDYFRYGHSRQNCLLRSLKSLSFNLFCLEYGNLDFVSHELQIADVYCALKEIEDRVSELGVENPECIICSESSGCVVLLNMLVERLSGDLFMADYVSRAKSMVFYRSRSFWSEGDFTEKIRRQVRGTFPDISEVLSRNKWNIFKDLFEGAVLGDRRCVFAEEVTAGIESHGSMRDFTRVKTPLEFVELLNKEFEF